MACIDPDGYLTVTAKFLLKSLAQESLSPEAIAKRMGEPLFKTRGNLREMSEAGLIQETDEGLFALTEAGQEKLG